MHKLVVQWQIPLDQLVQLFILKKNTENIRKNKNNLFNCRIYRQYCWIIDYQNVSEQ